MKKAPILLAVAIVFIWMPLANIFEDDFSNDIFTKRLAKIDWANEKQINKLTKAWSEYTKDQSGDKGFRDRIFLKEKTFYFKPFSMYATLRRHHKTGMYEIIFSNEVKDDFEFSTENFNVCNQISESFTKKLGVPYKKIDSSDGSIKDNFATIETRTQWKLGKTDFIINCINNKVYNGLVSLVIAMLGNDDNFTDVQEIIFLKCTHHRKLVGFLNDTGTVEEPTINLIINPNTETARSSTNDFGETKLFNQNEILLTKEKGDLKSVFKLDRVLGNYKHEIRLKSNPSKGSNGWGDCQKVDQSGKI